MKKYWPLALIFIFAFLVRFLSVWPANTIIGFDQARDLFDALKIVQGHLRIIGPTAGNNPNLHHGVAWLYFIAIPLIFSKNPIYVVLWNSLFNAGSAIVLYFLGESLFKSRKAGYIASLTVAVSYYFVQFSGWLSNPTATFITVPLFFLFLYKYYQGKRWALPFSVFFLGLTIEFELFFIYLIPAGIILWLILKPKLPSIKLFLLSVLSFSVATSTMIATEIKFHFAGVKSILEAGKLVGGTNKTGFFELLIDFSEKRWETFYLNFWPQNPNLGTIVGILATLFLVYEMVRYFKKKVVVKRNLFILVWFFSPAIMFILGIHNAPWFYIGRPAAAILIGAYIISKIKPKFLIVLVCLGIIYANLTFIKSSYGKGQPLLGPDTSSILSRQIAVMDYTYQKSQGNAFAIDTVTNPLYINAVWAWDYNWYYLKYGYKPTWLGGDQLPPYNTLMKATGKEKYLFLIRDETPRIPPVFTENAIKSMKEKGKLLEQKNFDGITVMVFTNQKP